MSLAKNIPLWARRAIYGFDGIDIRSFAQKLLSLLKVINFCLICQINYLHLEYLAIKAGLTNSRFQMVQQKNLMSWK